MCLCMGVYMWVWTPVNVSFQGIGVLGSCEPFNCGLKVGSCLCSTLGPLGEVECREFWLLASGYVKCSLRSLLTCQSSWACMEAGDVMFSDSWTPQTPLDPMEELSVLLTSEPPLQPLPPFIFWWALLGLACLLAFWNSPGLTWMYIFLLCADLGVLSHIAGLWQKHQESLRISYTLSFPSWTLCFLLS